MDEASSTPFHAIAMEAAKKKKPYHEMFWYPKRCEYEGCDDSSKKTGLMTCSACLMVNYCCKEHQKADWPMHKEEFHVFRRNNTRAHFYTDKEILAEYPLRNKKKMEADALKDPNICRMCSRDVDEKPMIRTQCFNHPICDTEHEYTPTSYSRDHCPRSHARYSHCGNHLREGHAGKDWRLCKKCVAHPDIDPPDMMWRGLNPYNFCPMLEKDVLKHSLCETCAVSQEVHQWI
jgi:hypothetical protein